MNPTKATIVIADDHQDILDFIAEDLEEQYHVIKVTNGREALEYVRLHPVDLIVSDVMMPVMDGYEFCTAIKDDLLYSHIPFIMLTAKNSLQSKIEGLEFGADAYIEKPFSPNFLQAQITSLLRNRKSLREHYHSAPSTPIEIGAHTKGDQVFLKKLNALILENMSEQSLCVDMLAERMCMSRPTLYRKIKALSDLSPNELINITRLKKATQLLTNQEYKVYEIANKLGFSTPSHFTRNFQKQFGISPKEFIYKMKQSANVS
ncbi:response regulator [Sphingobacterium sp. lm-10]|uniref:response regulator transcription factor n=1 Tax=Sphingobacterium sp. lm-10 TaxID=2944904 RepID=UPI0020219A99|nr:response regulator [Sphingobacterium sp. lm-10]MCL7987801.1 response regulator [Sphingobacterium sp. lm-10]